MSSYQHSDFRQKKDRSESLSRNLQSHPIGKDAHGVSEDAPLRKQFPPRRRANLDKLSIPGVAWLLLLLLASTASALTDLGITCSDMPDPVRVGNSLTYQIAITNRGPETAANVVVTDVLPPGATFVSCDPSQGSYSNDGDTVYCDLGDLLNGATAAVAIVATPNEVGTITNQASSSAVNASGGRAYAETTVNPANRAPAIALPGPHILPLGASTSFVVSVSDPDHDPALTITNTLKPTGAAFDGSAFSWTAPLSAFNSTNEIVFVADDQQGETNSIVTNRTQLIVPYDSDGDAMDDAWEWNNFSTLTNPPLSDVDNDGSGNRAEYIAGTQATNSESAFRVLSVTTLAGSSTHHIQVSTEPERQYTILWYDGDLEGTQSWAEFAASQEGVWVEDSVSSSEHVFIDDEGPSTTGGSPANGQRYYKIKVELP